ncbi:MAG: DegV family EDD domain-containing protein [Eubacterium sp.]|nr:DegV family EDD domain-containing protein [Eubacterium sp.]
MISRFIKYIRNDEVDISERVYVLNIHITTLLILLSMFARLAVRGMVSDTFICLVSGLAYAFVAITAFKLNKKGVGAVINCACLSDLFFPLIFFYCNGIHGDAPLWFIYGLMTISTITSGAVRKVLYFFAYFSAVVCYMVAVYYPNSLRVLPSRDAYLISIVTLVLLGTSVISTLILQNKLFEKENARVQEQNKEIEGLIASQNRFFSSMSHEIRTPINTIIGLNEMILREDISDEIAEDAVNIRAAGKMLLNTINDILDMSKFQAGDMKLLVENYNTGSMLSDLVGMLWIKAKEKNLELKINVAPDLPSELRGDEVRIKQILMNVLNNAIKYTKQGYVSLSVECDKKEDGNVNMIYTVEDTGMGIKKENIPYLFTAFKRVDESNTKHIEGTGLGLSIVKQFLDLMGGTVKVNSVYTKGSTFVIEIPQKIASEKELGEYDFEKRHNLKHRSNYKQMIEAPDAKLLVVDDNESNLLVVKKLLRETKIQIDTAKSGPQALQMTLDKKYDLIFMDHLMPDMDGIECFNAIRNQIGGLCRETNIVVLTANAGEENRGLYAKTGFNGYLVKPVSGADLEQELYRQLPKSLMRITDAEAVEDGESITLMTEGQKKSKVIITTDSGADLPLELYEKYDIAVFSLSVKTGEGVFKDLIEIDTPGILKYLENKENIAEAVEPTVQEFETFFAEQLLKANDVIFIATSSKIEGSSYPIAKEASKSFDNVYVLDSMNFSGGQGLVALMACRMAEAGMGAADIIPRLEIRYQLVKSSIMIDNLEYLARMQRVGTAYSNLMKALLLRPVTVMKEGRLVRSGFEFGSKERVWRTYIKNCISSCKPDDTVIVVNHVGFNKKDIEWIRNEIEKRFTFKKIIFQQSSPSIAMGCGPGSFGISFVEDREV